jgi:1-acyl-sn-glycerol-3-phosphate acyltransferase
MRGLLSHRYLRRLVTVPAVWLLLFVALTALPLWVLAAAAASPWLPGRWRPLRLLCFAVIYLALQVLGTGAAAALWVRSIFGRHLARADVQSAHYRLLGWLLGVLMHAAQRLFSLRLAVEVDPPPDVLPEVPHDDPRPLLILARHAGPGDSFLLVHELMSAYGRRPRVVLKDSLQWDPTVDLLLHRLPTRFVSPRPGVGAEVVASIGDLARGMTSEDALLIFPEGGNFTEERRRRGIERLEAAGQHEAARRARALRHLMAPRPGGAIAAIDGAPDADVIFVAHTGLEPLSSLVDLWRGLPMDTHVRARFFAVAAEDVPRRHDDRMLWLAEWWQRLDDWIEAQPR